jgi:hypothetical protein
MTDQAWTDGRNFSLPLKLGGYHYGGGSGVVGGEPFILDHSASCASLPCCLLSASRLSCSFDHHAKHVSPIINAKTSPFCSSRCREVLLLITRSPHQSLM